MKLSMSIDGAGRFRDDVSRIAGPDSLAEALEAAAEDIRAAARARLSDGRPPESLSGALAASLTAEMRGDGASVSVGTPLDHGWHLEFGSLGRPALPWLAPSLDDARASVLARLKSWLAASGQRSPDL